MVHLLQGEQIRRGLGGAGTKINTASSGSKAWVTNLTGNYNADEASFAYSPVL